AIHIGWKGAIKNILSNTIDTFIAMNANTDNIKLAIGPCIGPMSYEVKKDFYYQFIKINIKNKKYFISLNSNSFKFNLPEYIKDEALYNGILAKNISNLKRDTFIEKEMFFSFRRNYIKNIGDCGRMISTISINKKND
ncbi:MAG: polyphenol oxidase family protein, partial [Alphaproteobacteria bacterium]|nr:polyphenol oxidase family protein [Alphaproteobacteria bacterium]